MSGISFSGIGTGIDTASIIEKLMLLEARHQTAIKTRQSKAENLVAGFQQMNTKFLAIRTAGEALNLGNSWKLNKAVSSSETSVKATADSSALPGTVSFAVKNLATTQSVATFGTVSSTDTVIGTGQFLGGAVASLGLGSIVSNGLTNGAHTVQVTQASAGASVKGSVLGTGIVLDGTETLEVSISGGATQTISLAAGTYTQADLAKMVSSASGGTLAVSVNSDKSLKFSTVREGSAAGLNIVGGTGLAKLGLTAGATAAGTDGVISVDGVSTTVTDIRPGSSTITSLASTTGSIDATFDGGLRLGTGSVSAIDLGDGKLSTVVTALNAAKAGFSAQAVQVAPGEYKLQLTADKTGTAGSIAVSEDAFAATLGKLETITKGEDATLVFGTGDTAYEVKSSTNKVTGVLQGVTLDLLTADPTKQVSITVSGDGEKLADKVQKLVDAYNDVAKFIKDNSAYNPTTKVGGALLGDSMSGRLQRGLVSAMTYSVSGSSLNAMGQVGMKLEEDGQITFDKAKFAEAYAKNPDEVAKLFVSGGMNGPTDPDNPGIAERLISVAKQATDSVSGAITSRIKSTNNMISDYTRQIDDWSLRLEMRRKNLQQQFGAMEKAVSTFQAQGNWLAGQLAGLSSGSQ